MAQQVPSSLGTQYCLGSIHRTHVKSQEGCLDNSGAGEAEPAMWIPWTRVTTIAEGWYLV